MTTTKNNDNKNSVVVDLTDFVSAIHQKKIKSFYINSYVFLAKNIKTIMLLYSKLFVFTHDPAILVFGLIFAT